MRLLALCALVLVASGCARFNDAQSQPFTTDPELQAAAELVAAAAAAAAAQAIPQGLPRARGDAGLPGEHQRPDHAARQQVRAGRRAHHRRGQRGLRQRRAEGEDGHPGRPGPATAGLMDIVMSPTYKQDRLMYAYISTPTDNRVIRVADGDIPKDILTGIPKGAHREHRRADLHQPHHAGRDDRRRGQSGAGRRPGIAGGQGAAHRAAHHAWTRRRRRPR